MKIEFEKPKQSVHFAALDIGTVFRNPKDDSIYMKTECLDNEGDEINSVDLFSGEFDCFPDDAKIDPVEATLYVKE